MIRVILTELTLFLAPFAFYGIYLAVRGRRPQWSMDRRAAGRVFGLAMAGAVLAVGFLLLFGEQRSAPPGSRYIPPHMEDGVYVPGRFVPRETL